jgi:hypothetical protein
MPRRIRKIATFTALVALVLVVAAIVGAFGYRVYRHSVIARATTIDPAERIDEQLFASIGGIELDQHSGPKPQQSDSARRSRRTWIRHGPLAPGVTIDRMVQDGIEVFVFQGAQDNVTPVRPGQAYVDSISAPRSRPSSSVRL